MYHMNRNSPFAKRPGPPVATISVNRHATAKSAKASKISFPAKPVANSGSSQRRVKASDKSVKSNKSTKSISASVDTRRATEEYLLKLDKQVKQLGKLGKIDEEQRDDVAKEEEEVHKETYIRSLAEPDVIIVVGKGLEEREYHEYSQMLRSWSGYFDYELRIQQPIAEKLNMIRLGSEYKAGISTTTVRFEFPNRKPKEWEWIISLMAPMPTERVNKSNLLTALSWFDELLCKRGLAECDRVFAVEVAAIMDKRASQAPSMLKHTSQHSVSTMRTSATSCTLTPKETTKKLSFVIHALELCLRYGLETSKSICLETLSNYLEDQPTTFKDEMIKRICFFLKEDDDCRLELWDPLMAFVPKSYSLEQKELLLENRYLHEVVNLTISQRRDKIRSKNAQANKPKVVHDPDQMVWEYLDKTYLLSKLAEDLQQLSWFKC